MAGAFRAEGVEVSTGTREWGIGGGGEAASLAIGRYARGIGDGDWFLVRRVGAAL